MWWCSVELQVGGGKITCQIYITLSYNTYLQVLLYVEENRDIEEEMLQILYSAVPTAWYYHFRPVALCYYYYYYYYHYNHNYYYYYYFQGTWKPDDDPSETYMIGTMDYRYKVG